MLGDLDGSNVNIVGLAARSVPEPGAASTLIGLGIFTVVGWVRDRNKLSK